MTPGTQPPVVPAVAAAPKVIELPVRPKGFWDLVSLQFKKNRLAVWSLYTIGALFWLAAWAPIIANGKPFVWDERGRHDVSAFRRFPGSEIQNRFDLQLFLRVLHRHPADVGTSAHFDVRKESNAQFTKILVCRLYFSAASVCESEHWIARSQTGSARPLSGFGGNTRRVQGRECHFHFAE